MSRDYSRQPQRKRSPAKPKKKTGTASGTAASTRRPPAQSQRGGLSLKWALSLATVGGFIGFIVYLNSLPASDPGAAKQQEGPSSSSTAKVTKEEKPGYKFYDMLPDSEVVPPQVEEYSPGPGQATVDYLVQTGSFRTREDAERQRAQIAFQGLRAYVSEIKLDSGTIWYRVNVGPIASRSQMNSAVDKLVSINIEPLIRKVPKTSEQSTEDN